MARVAIAFVLGLLASPWHAFAQSTGRGPALNWVRLPGAESCIAPVELAERVEQRLHRRVFVRMPDAIVVVEGQVAPAAGSGFAAVVRVSDLQGTVYGTRELAIADADCRRLDDVLALVIAVTIRGGTSSAIALPPAIQAELDALFADEPFALDPEALPASPQRDTSAASAAQPALAAPTDDDPERPPSSPEPAPKLGLGAGFAAVTGLQPDGTIGPSAHVRVRVPPIGSAVLSAALGFPQSHAVSDPMRGDGTVTLQPLLVALALCGPDLPTLASAIALCAHVALGRLEASATGFAANFAVSGTWLELGPEASATVPVIAPLYARFLLRMPVRTSQPAFVYRRLDGTRVEVHRAAQVGFGGELALGIDLF